MLPEIDSQMNGDLTVCFRYLRRKKDVDYWFIRSTLRFFFFKFQPIELPPIGSAGSPYQLPPSAHHNASAAAMMAHRHLAAAASVKSDPNIKIELENAELWQQFHQIGTEMIITKLGRCASTLDSIVNRTICTHFFFFLQKNRRMFPTLKVNLSGLDPNTKYFVLLDLVLADDSRFRFNAGWLRSGKAEPQWPSRIYTHPDSPATGAQWMKHEISFQKVKLTNNTMDQQGHVRVSFIIRRRRYRLVF